MLLLGNSELRSSGRKLVGLFWTVIFGGSFWKIYNLLDESRKREIMYLVIEIHQLLLTSISCVNLQFRDAVYFHLRFIAFTFSKEINRKWPNHSLFSKDHFSFWRFWFTFSTNRDLWITEMSMGLKLWELKRHQLNMKTAVDLPKVWIFSKIDKIYGGN